jgi:hypothetical protein
MSDKEAGMPVQSSKAAAKPETASTVEEPAVDLATVDGPPERSGEDFRKEWAEFNNVDPSDMREIHAVGGWIDRFDGRGWVQEG